MKNFLYLSDIHVVYKEKVTSTLNITHKLLKNQVFVPKERLVSSQLNQIQPFSRHLTISAFTFQKVIESMIKNDFIRYV